MIRHLPFTMRSQPFHPDENFHLCQHDPCSATSIANDTDKFYLVLQVAFNIA